MSQTSSDNDRLLRLPEVKRVTGLGRSTIYDAANRMGFPKPVKLGKKCTRWKVGDIRAFIAGSAA